MIETRTTTQNALRDTHRSLQIAWNYPRTSYWGLVTATLMLSGIWLVTGGRKLTVQKKAIVLANFSPVLLMIFLLFDSAAEIGAIFLLAIPIITLLVVGIWRVLIRLFFFRGTRPQGPLLFYTIVAGPIREEIWFRVVPFFLIQAVIQLVFGLIQNNFWGMAVLTPGTWFLVVVPLLVTVVTNRTFALLHTAPRVVVKKFGADNTYHDNISLLGFGLSGMYCVVSILTVIYESEWQKTATAPIKIFHEQLPYHSVLALALCFVASTLLHMSHNSYATFGPRPLPAPPP